MNRTSEKNSAGTEQAGVGTGRHGNPAEGSAKGKESQIIKAKKKAAEAAEKVKKIAGTEPGQ